MFRILGLELLAVCALLFPFSASASPELVWVADLLVVYTPAARVSALPSDTDRELGSAVAEADVFFDRGAPGTRIRLVHSIEVPYEESGSLKTDLERLRTRGDGFLDEVHNLRDQYAADLVCLVVADGSDYNFRGLQGPSADNAFTAIRRSALTGAYFLPVALSFNFGCQLERPWADTLGAFAFAHGYSASVGGRLYSTVEAFAGARLPFFSN